MTRFADHVAKEWEGTMTASGLRVALAVARFNRRVVEDLVDGAIDAFVRQGGKKDDLMLAWAPGAFELPQLARALIDHHGPSAVVCLGAVIRGDTPHFDYVAGHAASGIAMLNNVKSVPVTLGVLTCDTMEQATDRAGGKAGNKGAEAMVAAIEMARLFHLLGSPKERK